MKIKTIQRRTSWAIPGFSPSALTLVPERHLPGWQLHLRGPMVYLQRHDEVAVDKDGVAQSVAGSQLYRLPPEDMFIHWELEPGETIDSLPMGKWSSPIFQKLKDPSAPPELTDVPPTAEALENERDDFDGEAPISLGKKGRK